jgi:hypothetical protein
MANDFIVDVKTGRLISDFLSTKAAGRPGFIYGDKPDISVRLVETNSNDADLPWTQLDLTGKTIRLAIGNPGGDATGGTYILDFDGDPTTALLYNTEAADVQTALNLLPSIISAGGVTVAAFGTVSSGYRVTFDSAGVRDLITADSSALTPSTSTFIATVQAGDGSTKAAQIVTFETDANAYVELTDDLPTTPVIEVTTVTQGNVGNDTPEVQRVVITGDPHAGTYSLSIDSQVTDAIAFDASTDEIETALESLSSIGAGGVTTVTGSSIDYTVTFHRSLGNVDEAVPDPSNLSGPVGKTGELDLNTTGMLELLDGASSTTSVLEIIEFTISGSKESTVLQTNCTVTQDVVPSTPPSATPAPDYPDRVEVFPVPVEISGTSYTLDVGDIQSYLYTTNSSPVAITVPPFSSEAFSPGDAVLIEQYGTGQVTIVQGSGVDVRKPTTQTRTTRSQYSTILLVNKLTDDWTLSGDTDFA